MMIEFQRFLLPDRARDRLKQSTAPDVGFLALSDLPPPPPPPLFFSLPLRFP